MGWWHLCLNPNECRSVNLHWRIHIQPTFPVHVALDLHITAIGASNCASDMSTNDDDVDVQAMFQEPEGYLQPEKPFTYESFELEDGRSLELRLVGNNPLWVGASWTS